MSWEVVVLPDVRDATSGLLHHLQSVVIQISCHLQRQRRWMENITQVQSTTGCYSSCVVVLNVNTLTL